jgi:hypothetical protein
MAADPSLIAHLQTLCEQATKLQQMAAQLCAELGEYIQQAQADTWKNGPPILERRRYARIPLATTPATLTFPATAADREPTRRTS